MTVVADDGGGATENPLLLVLPLFLSLSPLFSPVAGGWRWSSRRRTGEAVEAGDGGDSLLPFSLAVEDEDEGQNELKPPPL